MKIKKKIDVEIETSPSNSGWCSCICNFRERGKILCILFEKNLTVLEIGKDLYVTSRCKECIEAFGMEQQEEYKNKCSGCFKDIHSDKPVCDECHKRLVQKHWGMGEE